MVEEEKGPTRASAPCARRALSLAAVLFLLSAAQACRAADECEKAGGEAYRAKLREGMQQYQDESFREASCLFREAMQAVDSRKDLEAEEDKQKARDQIREYLIQSLFDLGDFPGAISEIGKLGHVGDAMKQLLGKIKDYSSLSQISPDEQLDSALKDCKGSAHLLEIRVRKNMRRGNYNHAERDLLRMEKYNGQSQRTKRLQMQLHFLKRNYAKGMELLKEFGGHADLLDAFGLAWKTYVEAYAAAATEKKLRLLKSLEKRVTIEKAQDSFLPSIFTELHIQVLEDLSRTTEGLWLPDAPHYAGRLVQVKKDMATKEDHSRYCRALIQQGRYGEAERAMGAHFAKGSVEYKKLEDFRQKSSEKQKREQAERKRAEEAERERQKEAERKKEKEQEKWERTQRERFVGSRRRSDPDPEKFYQTLGIPPKSSIEDVKDAYKKVMIKYNPGKMKRKEDKENARNMLVRANKAKEVLADKDKKDEYDSGRYMTEKERQEWGYTPGQQGGQQYDDLFNNQKILEAFFKQGGFQGFGGRGGTRRIYVM